METVLQQVGVALLTGALAGMVGLAIAKPTLFRHLYPLMWKLFIGVFALAAAFGAGSQYGVYVAVNAVKGIEKAGGLILAAPYVSHSMIVYSVAMAFFVVSTALDLVAMGIINHQADEAKKRQAD